MTSTIYLIEQQKLMVMEVECWGETTEDDVATAPTIGERLWNLLDRMLVALGTMTVPQHICDDETMVYYHPWMTGC
jgi:hypothetical protein